MQSDLDKVLDGLHAFERVGIAQDLSGHPEGLLVHDLLELLQVAVASSAGVQLKQFVHILGGLDVTEQDKVSHGELRSHLHGAELQETDLTLPQELLSVFIRAKCLCLHVVLQVVPE